MENIFTGTQVHEYSLRSFIFIFLLVFSIQAVGQTTSGNKKAVKFFEKAKEQARLRQFNDAISSYKKAINKDENFADAYLRLAGLYSFLRILDSAYTYYKGYYHIVPHENMPPKQARSLSAQFFVHGDYELAREAFDSFKGRVQVESLRYADSVLDKSISYSMESLDHPIEVSITRLSDSVNRFPLQYFPVLTIDNRTIFFTRRRGLNPKFDEDIVFSEWKEGAWSKAQSVSKQINTTFNEGACSISADGRTMIFTSCEGRRSFGNCDLYITVREGDKWSRPQNMGSAVNSSYWDSQPSLSADGQTLFFASNRPGGVGKRDIWVSKLQKRLWSKPQNLGKGINTPHDETTPFIHANGKSLFFSSEGHAGLGGFDLYVVEEKDSTWTKARNVGYPINDFHDQIGLFITADGQQAYYTDENKSGSQLYKFEITQDTLISERASYLTGTVRDKNENFPLFATLDIYDLDTQERLYHTTTDPTNGTYFVALREGGDYGIYVASEGYIFEDFSFNLKSSEVLKPDTLNVWLSPIKLGASMILENIYFEFDSYDLQSKSFSELLTATDFIMKNAVQIEIAGHTDNKGSDAYNQRLSENRAKTVYDYLLSKGVPKNKISYAGYGSTLPINQEQSDAAHQENRRIEFRVIGVEEE